MNKDEIKAKIGKALSVFDDVNIIDIIKDYVVENYGEETLILFNDDDCTICETPIITDNVRFISGVVVIDGRLILHVEDDRGDEVAFNEAILKGDKREQSDKLHLPLTSFIAILENITNSKEIRVWKKEDYAYLNDFIECYHNNKDYTLLDESNIVSYWC